MNALKLVTTIEQWPLSEPFRITGRTFEVIDVLLVSLTRDGHTGRGEAVGVYYQNDTPEILRERVESVRIEIERGISTESLRRLLPPGGARNALDCAMWDLDAKLQARPAWQIAGIAPPTPIVTTFTCGADDPERMVAAARSYRGARAIKLKLTGEPVDIQRVRQVREALPEVWLAVDANQGFTLATLEQLMPTLVEARVAAIEQPLRVGDEAQLERFGSPIPIIADESSQSLEDVPQLVGRFDGLNIKLDKSGGLTEALAMARKARELGLVPMVGNMFGTSLAMAPAFLVGQLCDVVELDGPIYLRADRTPPAKFEDGRMSCPGELWGGALAHRG